jgi:hypothetical protein
VGRFADDLLRVYRVRPASKVYWRRPDDVLMICDRRLVPYNICNAGPIPGILCTFQLRQVVVECGE